jgi:hypothetical protein
MPVMVPRRGLAVAPQVGVLHSRGCRLLKRPSSQPRPPPATPPITIQSAVIYEFL